MNCVSLLAKECSGFSNTVKDICDFSNTLLELLVWAFSLLLTTSRLEVFVPVWFVLNIKLRVLMLEEEVGVTIVASSNRFSQYHITNVDSIFLGFSLTINLEEGLIYWNLADLVNVETSKVISKEFLNIVSCGKLYLIREHRVLDFSTILIVGSNI